MTHNSRLKHYAGLSPALDMNNDVYSYRVASISPSGHTGGDIVNYNYNNSPKEPIFSAYYLLKYPIISRLTLSGIMEIGVYGNIIDNNKRSHADLFGDNEPYATSHLSLKLGIGYKL
jgi:hypothetical protein